MLAFSVSLTITPSGNSGACNPFESAGSRVKGVGTTNGNRNRNRNRTRQQLLIRVDEESLRDDANGG